MTYKYQSNPDYKSAIHYSPDPKNWNVACANGSAHIWKTKIPEHVTCPICREKIEKRSHI